MKQILQSLKDGSIAVTEVPVPCVRPHHLLIENRASLVSPGTERMLLEFGKASWLGKARQQPDKVRDVLEKVSTDGFGTTLEAVKSRFEQPLAPGYCAVGRVIEIGPGAVGFQPGMRVVSNGPHAEVVCVPRTLCAAIPDLVSDEAAGFTVLAAIGLQGIRLAQPTLGECVVVIGLGLIGLLSVQLLRAQGCRVLAIDFNSARCEIAQAFGAETAPPGVDGLAAAKVFSRGHGVDAVLITASSKSNAPVRQAANMCRKRGRIVLVGVVGLELNRADFYAKELTFQVSCSYGPGRHDPMYEASGQDYPIGFVRWTEQRNFEAVLDLMAVGALDVKPLISHRFPLDRSAQAFALLRSCDSSLGIILKHRPDRYSRRASRQSVSLTTAPPPGKASVAFLGAGNHAGRVLIPAFAAAGANLHSIVSRGGVSAVHFGRKYGFANARTGSAAVLNDGAIDTIVIATRHNAHAGQVLAALQADKHVFCEKPLCLTLSELADIEQEAKARPDQHLMVGFNRRFAPQIRQMKALLKSVKEPKSLIMTVNAGDLPADHWTQDMEIGGGRIIGEACHFIDLLRHLAGAPITGHAVAALGGQAGQNDRVTITLRFANGSVGTVHYLANGHKAFPKERLEVFTAGRVLQLDNFRRLRGWGWAGFSRMRLWRQDKGNKACAAAFIGAVQKGTAAPIPIDEIVEVSRSTLEIAHQITGLGGSPNVTDCDH